jgi:hypothetical protein
MATDWPQRVRDILATLDSLRPDQFYNEETEQYHPVHEDVVALAGAFNVDRDRLAHVLEKAPVARQCWLPNDSPDDLSSMDVNEIYWRLRENIADERWVDSAMAETFESGMLVAALKRLALEVDTLTPNTEPRPSTSALRD